MRKFYHNRTARLAALLCLGGSFVFYVLIGYQFYLYQEDTPQAPCYSAIRFQYIDYGGKRWVGTGDMSINMAAGAYFVYFNILTPDGDRLTYNRKIDSNFTKLDSSRFLFTPSGHQILEGDTSGGRAAFMSRGLEGGLITFTRFSGSEYYYNINNILIGVCHVPS